MTTPPSLPRSSWQLMVAREVSDTFFNIITSDKSPIFQPELTQVTHHGSMHKDMKLGGRLVEKTKEPGGLGVEDKVLGVKN